MSATLPGETRAPLASTARPQRDDNNRFFAQMDDAISRLPPGTAARKSRPPAAAGASSRRPPATQKDAAAAVAAASSARARLVNRLRAAAARRDAGVTHPLPGDESAAAGLNGPPTSSPAPTAALASVAAVVAAAAAAATTAATPPATVGHALGDGSTAGGVPCSCRTALVEMSAALQQISTVMSGLLQALFDERAATSADFFALRRSLAVVLANSVSSKADVAKVHALANATSVSVGTIASASSALAYNTAATAGDQTLRPSPRQSQQQQSGAGSLAVSKPHAEDEPMEVSWAIPMQVRLVSASRLSPTNSLRALTCPAAAGPHVYY